MMGLEGLMGYGGSGPFLVNGASVDLSMLLATAQQNAEDLLRMAGGQPGAPGTAQDGDSAVQDAHAQVQPQFQAIQNLRQQIQMLQQQQQQQQHQQQQPQEEHQLGLIDHMSIAETAGDQMPTDGTTANKQ